MAKRRRKRRSGMRSVPGVKYSGSACKTWLTKYGTRMMGCYNAKGEFRIKGKA